MNIEQAIIEQALIQALLRRIQSTQEKVEITVSASGCSRIQLTKDGVVVQDSCISNIFFNNLENLYNSGRF